MKEVYIHTWERGESGSITNFIIFEAEEEEEKKKSLRPGINLQPSIISA